jgi:hypothetical protein
MDWKILSRSPLTILTLITAGIDSFLSNLTHRETPSLHSARRRLPFVLISSKKQIERQIPTQSCLLAAANINSRLTMISHPILTLVNEM